MEKGVLAPDESHSLQQHIYLHLSFITCEMETKVLGEYFDLSEADTIC